MGWFRSDSGHAVLLPGLYSVLYVYFVLHVVRSEFGNLAKSQMCCGELAESQTVLQVLQIKSEQTRH
jgi:hypothetical protein